MAVFRAIERILVWSRGAGAIVIVSREVVAADNFFRRERILLNQLRVIPVVVAGLAATAKHRVRVVDTRIDDANANTLSRGGKLTSIPDVRHPDERDARRGQRVKLNDRFDVNHTIELPQALYLAKRKANFLGVGQAGKLRLQRALHMA